jgi:APA family basic amino acid/polyamine antiporter
MAELKRAVGLLEASVYGVGLILGAGIYAILGEAVAETGESIIVSFVLAAGVATFTGLSYAELASRYPKGEGEYLYAWAAFENKRLSEVTAFLRVL